VAEGEGKFGGRGKQDYIDSSCSEAKQEERGGEVRKEEKPTVPGCKSWGRFSKVEMDANAQLRRPGDEPLILAGKGGGRKG